MSKNINVNPDHYKTAGRERQGENVIVSEHKQRFVNVQSDLAARAEQRSRSIEAMRKREEQLSPGKTAAKRASKATKKTKRAAGNVGAGARAVATNVAAKAKKAVKPRSKQALSKKPGKAGPAARPSRTVPKKKSAPARKK